jgi:putative transcriptional regulator
MISGCTEFSRTKADSSRSRNRDLDRKNGRYDTNHKCSLGDETRKGTLQPIYGATMKKDTQELTKSDFARSITRTQRTRLMRGQFESGDDVVALRRFVGLTQKEFAEAIGISVHTLRNWEQGRRQPEGPALALLRIAARHPKIVRENLATAA